MSLKEAPIVIVVFLMCISVLMTALLAGVIAVFMSGILGVINGRHLIPSEWPLICHFIIYFVSTGLVNLLAYSFGFKGGQDE